MSASTDTALELAQTTAEAVGVVLGGFGSTVEMGTAEIIPRESNPLDAFPVPAVVSTISYVGGVSGGNVLAFTATGARAVAALMGAGDDSGQSQLSELALSAVSEAANQTLAAAAGATSKVVGREVDVSPPVTKQVAEMRGVVEAGQAEYVTSVAFTVEGEACRLVQFIPQAFVLRVEAGMERARDPSSPDAVASIPTSGGFSSAAWLPPTRLSLGVELGRARLSAHEVVDLHSGAVVALDRRINDPIELHVNGRLFATGKLLLNDGQWAVAIESLRDE